MLANDDLTPTNIDHEWAALELTAHGTLESRGGIPVLRLTDLAIADNEDSNE